MAEEQVEAAEADAPPKKKGRKWLGTLIWLVISLTLGGVGFAIPMMFPQLIEEKAQADAEEKVAEENAEPAFVEFGDIVVNLNSDRLNRYLRLAITLQTDVDEEETVTEAVETKKVILKSWLISYLSDVRMEDIRGTLGQNRVRRRIQDYFNSALFDDGYDRIRDVLFEEFNVQ